MKKAIFATLILSAFLCGCNSNQDTTTEPTPWIPVTIPKDDVDTETAPPLFEIETTIDIFDDLGDWFGDPIQLPDIDFE